MIIIRPEETTESDLISTTAVNEYSDYDSEAAYVTGDRAVYNLKVWESLVDSPTLNPEEGAISNPVEWIKVGYCNKYRMFYEGSDSKTEANQELRVRVKSNNLVTAIALFGLSGFSVTINTYDENGDLDYSKTTEMSNAGVNNWYDYFFLPYDFKTINLDLNVLPIYAPEIEIVVQGDGNVTVGRMIYGIKRRLGASVHGTSVRWLDASIRRRDEFNNLEIVPRRRVKLIDYDVAIETDTVDFVNLELNKLANRPTVFVGQENAEATTTFGFYRDFDIVISDPAISNASVEVEGY